MSSKNKRPYLVVTAKHRPAQGAHTQMAGWAEASGWEVDEQIEFVNNVKTRHLQQSAAVIDVLGATVVSSTYKNVSRDDVLRHYLTKYQDQIKSYLGYWMEQKAQEMARSGVVTPELVEPSEDQTQG